MAGKRPLALPADLLAFIAAHSVRDAAHVLGIGKSTVQRMLHGDYPLDLQRVLAAWDACPDRLNPVSKAIFASMTQSLDAPKKLAPKAAGPNPANLDSAGKRYVATGCMVELPDLAMAKVGLVENGRWWLPCGLEPHPAPCNAVRVLMRTYSESMGSFYWA